MVFFLLLALLKLVEVTSAILQESHHIQETQSNHSRLQDHTHAYFNQ